MEFYSDTGDDGVIVYSSDLKIKKPEGKLSWTGEYIVYSVMMLALIYCVYSFMKMKSKRREHETEVYKFLEKQLRE